MAAKQFHEMSFFMQGTNSSAISATPSPAGFPVPWFFGSDSNFTELSSDLLCPEKQYLQMAPLGGRFVPFFSTDASSSDLEPFFPGEISGISRNLVPDSFHRVSKKPKCPKDEKEDETYPNFCLLDELKLHYWAPPWMTSERASRSSGKDEMGRQRRRRVTDKFEELKKLIPPSKSKMDMATMLGEAIKYVKFLEAQVSTLNWMPLQAMGYSSPSRQQLLQVMVNSAAVQRELYSNGRCVFSAEQVELLKVFQMKRRMVSSSILLRPHFN